MAGYLTPAWVNDSAPAIDADSLIDLGEAVEISEHPYGVCSTAAATAAKTVTIDFSGTLTLFAGLTVRVKFTYGNTAANPTLNVNSTSDVPIMAYGTTNAPLDAWMAGQVVELTYDGTNWQLSKPTSADLGFNTDNSTYLFRQTGGGVTCEDTEVISELTGGTVAWNQQATVSLYNSGAIGITLTNNNDGSITINGTSTAASTAYTVPRLALVNNGVIGNHVYYWSGIKGATSSTYRLQKYGSGGNITSTSESGIIYREPANPDQNNSLNLQIMASGVSISNIKYIPQLIDLTQMFGSTVADYIYTLEQGTAGAGVAFFRSLFPNSYYAYNAGQLISVNPSAHKTVGFNIWDGVFTSGNGVDVANGSLTSNSSLGASDYIQVLANKDYFLNITSFGSNGFGCAWYDDGKRFVSAVPFAAASGKVGVLTSPASAKYLRVSAMLSEIDSVCVNISNASRNGTYEPYKSQSNPFGGIEIRGVPQLVNNALTFDGDSYKCDGQLTRKYGVVDLGTAGWTYSTAGATRFISTTIKNDVKKPSSSAVVANIICGLYPSASADDVYDGAKAVSIVASGASAGEIWICDTAYNDASTFKAAMSGVYLVYELDSPTTESADPFTSCQVCDPDGTEQWVDAQVVAGNRDVSMPVQTLTRYPVGYAAAVAKVLMPVTAYSPVSAIASKTPDSWYTPNTTNASIASDYTKCTKAGNVVTITFEFTALLSGNLAIMTLESGYRPLRVLQFSPYNSTDAKAEVASLVQSGIFTLYGAQANNTYVGTVTYISD